MQQQYTNIGFYRIDDYEDLQDADDHGAIHWAVSTIDCAASQSGATDIKEMIDMLCHCLAMEVGVVVDHNGVLLDMDDHIAKLQGKNKNAG